MIREIPLRTMAIACNQYLKADPQTWPKIVSLDGKVIAFSLQNWHLNLKAVFTKDGVEFKPQDNKFDAKIKLTTETLLQILTNPSTKPTQLKGVTIQGDLHLMQNIMEIMQAMDIDWEEKISYITGDILAHEISKHIRNTRNIIKNAIGSVKLNMADYLQEEIRILPSKNEIESFYQDIAKLRDDVARFQAKLNRSK